MTSSSNYEFDSSQNALFKDLARKMGFVGTLAVIGGILSLIVGLVIIFAWLSGQREGISIENGLDGLIRGVFLVLIGQWTRKAASSFSRIVQTQGNDIENLMGAMGELRKLYTLQYYLAIIALALISLAVLVALIAVVAGMVMNR